MGLKQIAGAVGFVVLMATSVFSATTEFKGYGFEANIVKSSGQRYKEFSEHRQPTLKVRPNEEYSIVVWNPLPVAAAVAVTIDGLNSIDGKRTSPRNAQKWMIAPHSSITISGWQTSKDTLRKFLFTEQTESLAQWREDKDGKLFTKNLGVIGVAWFWNREDLDQALNPPQPFKEDREFGASSSRLGGARPAMKSQGPKDAMSSSLDEPKAGTGMGHQEKNRVTEVHFNPNAGMFDVKDVLKVFYEFAKDSMEPAPFVDDNEEEGRFTPDMHR